MIESVKYWLDLADYDIKTEEMLCWIKEQL